MSKTKFIACCLRRDITTETVVRQRTTEAEIEDVTKRYGTKHSAAKPTRNDLHKFVQDLQKGRFEKLSEILNLYTNDQPEQWNK